MALSPGDRVRCYNNASHPWVVEDTEVPTDVDVDGSVWRLPDGDTLVRHSKRDDVYMVVPSRLISEMD